MQIPGFSYQRVKVGGGIELNVAVGGAGRAVVLLHGFPQTHLMWRHVAADLVDSADALALARELGHERLAVIGHDRGALVAIRAGLDHPDVISHVACLDVLPTLDMWDVLHGETAAVAFHLYLMAQPPGLPEAMIAASADRFFGYFLDAWSQSPDAIPPEFRDAYLTASANAVPRCPSP